MATDKSVLIVEDEISLLEPLEEKFKDEGYVVFTGKNGEEGLKVAEKEKPSIILLDITMPVMNGIEMLKKLRENPDTKDLKVMMMTNMSDPSTAGETASLGVFEYLVKADWKLNDIVDRVEKSLSG